MNSRVIIACDFDSEIKLKQFLAQFNDEKLFLKLGMELIYSAGFNIINQLVAKGHKIFLDLKIHDITNTMLKTLKVLEKYPIAMLTIHISAGKESLQTLKDNQSNKTIKLLGVSVLTNLNQNEIQKIYLNPNLQILDLVLNLANLAAISKLDGIICSAWESSAIKQRFPDLITVCPGIRLTQATSDQKRVVSPQLAKQLKVDYIVVGREITSSSHPYSTYKKIKNIFQGTENE